MVSIALSDFLVAVFSDMISTIYLRAFQSKDAKGEFEASAMKWKTTIAELRNDRQFQNKLKQANKLRGIYYVVNSGGERDSEITQYNAFFVENDKLPIQQQHALLDNCQLLPSIRVETLKSVHAYWLIEGECTETEWRDIQSRLIENFNSDKAIHNPSRVMRLPFFNHVSFDGEKLLYKRVELTEFEPTRRYTVQEMQSAFSEKRNTNLSQSYVSANYESKQSIIPDTERNTTLASLAGSMRRRGMTENAIFEALKVENSERCQPPLEIEEVYSISRSISRYTPDENLVISGSNEGSGQNPLKPLRTINLADVKAQAVNWLWNPFIAFGTFTLIDGEEGIGKSLITLGLGSAIANGKGFDTTVGFVMVDTEPGKVLLLSAEESLSFVVKPRLLAMGASVEQFIAVDEPFSFDRDGLIRLELAIAAHEPRIVIIDPLFSYAGQIRLNDDNDIRRVTNELIRIAEKFECAILGVRHIGKAKGNGDARAAGLNGVGWRASARSALLVGKDPNTGELAICQHKNNLAAKSTKSYGFRIETTFVEVQTGEQIEVGKFFWTGESQLTEKQMLSQGSNYETQLEESDAIAFLREALSAGERGAKEIQEEAVKLGITLKQLRVARAKLNIQSGNGTIRREGFGEGSKNFWRLPLIDALEF